MSEQKKETLEVVKDFKYAYRGCDVVEYKAGEIVELNEEVAELAKSEKWAKKPGKKTATENKSQGAAPENKAAETGPGSADITTGQPAE